ncbi:MAG TPA: ATP-binding protein [Planctomycetota bacterium]|nr:ATP-binding protein [Planctomycetota bacterium]
MMTYADTEQQRLRLLCDVGAALAAGGDNGINLAAAAVRGCAPLFADWCALDLVSCDRSLHRQACGGEAEGGRFEVLQRLRAGEVIARAFKDMRAGEAEVAHGDAGRAAFIAVPLVARACAIGVVSFARFGAPFADDDRLVAGEIARRLALTIDNAQLVHEAQHVRQEAETLHDIGLTLASELDAARVMQEVTDAGTDLLGARFGAFLPCWPEGRGLEAGVGAQASALIGLTRERFAAMDARAGELFEPTLRHGAMLRVADIAADPRFAGPIEVDAWIVRSFMAVPVVSRGGAVVGGLFFGHDRADAFTRRHEAMLGGIAAQAATALDNARLYEAERKARAAVEQAIASLEQGDERLRLALRAGRMGIWNWDVANDRVTCSDQVERIFGLSGPAPLTRAQFIGLVHEGDRDTVAAAFARALAERGEFLAEFRVRVGDGVRWVAHRGQVCAGADGKPLRLSGVCMDVTVRHQVDEALARHADQLTASNAELEQFAYIASHDLQEPLRMVTSYLALLKRRYAETLDAKAQEYIGFAVDGSQRMLALINDLLAYSRAGRGRERPATTVPSEQAMVEALNNLRSTVTEAGATITHADLPPLRFHHLQLVQLFQNLIGNALKFRGEVPPVVEITAERGEGEWILHVRDNGIGIAPEYHQRIFEVFQRLHARGEYAGTGIGLAICKKIVERIGGRIWVTSASGAGATFSLAIPD